MAQVREPAVAGQFYAGDKVKLEAEVRSYVKARPAKLNAFGIVSPHAGYMYSGPVAGAVFGSINVPEHIIILCPNHTGIGQPLAITSEGTFRTPLGEARIDTALAESLKAGFPLLKEDETAQIREHAIEVQLPFLQMERPDFSFVPITVGTGQYEVLSALGIVIAKTIEAAKRPVLIIASSDMNHYEDDESTRIKDALAIEQVLMLDPKGLFDTVKRENITMCGYGPTVAMLTAVRRLGAKNAELVRYATSGDVSGDKNWVVGYAGIAVI